MSIITGVFYIVYNLFLHSWLFGLIISLNMRKKNYRRHLVYPEGVLVKFLVFCSGFQRNRYISSQASSRLEGRKKCQHPVTTILMATSWCRAAKSSSTCKGLQKHSLVKAHNILKQVWNNLDLPTRNGKSATALPLYKHYYP